jgi:transcriptional regulator with XRE-family HTH domain
VKFSAQEKNSMLSPIKTRISGKLADKKYRHAFFKGRGEIEIAYDLRRFRKMRGLSQGELAQLCGMKQSAISRIEQASKWNIATIWRIAEALDVRVRVAIDDMSEAIHQYELREALEESGSSTISPHDVSIENLHSTDILYVQTSVPAVVNEDQFVVQ